MGPPLAVLNELIYMNWVNPDKLRPIPNSTVCFSSWDSQPIKNFNYKPKILAFQRMFSA